MAHRRPSALLPTLGVALAMVVGAACGSSPSTDATQHDDSVMLGPIGADAAAAGADTAAAAGFALPVAASPPATTTGPTAPTPTAAPTVPAPTPTVPAPVPGRVTMAFGGDSLWHSPLWRQAAANQAAGAAATPGYDFTPMLAGLAPLVGGVDLAVCHLETPLAPAGEEYSTYPLFGVPAEVVTAIAAAGFDRCSAASNHTADRGPAGIDRTVDALTTAGLGVSGMARTPAEIQPRVFEVNGVNLAHLSYTFSYNGLHLPADQQWRSALIDPARIIADATAARALGAEFVIVSLHWGIEGDSAVSGAQRQLAETLTASGVVDLIVGHHAHVLQPIEQVNGVWVVYGLGNLVSNMPTGARWPAATQDGAIVTLTVTRRADGGFDVATPVVHPTWCDRQAGWIVRLVRPTLADPATPAGLRHQLETSLARTTRVLGPYIES